MNKNAPRDATLNFHIQVLFDELRARKQKNVMYSMRAFANQLEIHPSALSRAMAGKEELSLQACLRMIRRLPLNNEEKLRFVTSVADEKYERAMRSMGEEIDPSINVSLAPDRVAIFDREGRYVFLSPRTLDIVKKPATFLIGKKPSEAGYPTDLAKLFEDQVEETFRTQKPSTIRFTIEMGGSPKNFNRSATGLIGEGGDIDRVFCLLSLVPAPKDEKKI